jgi:hypothetical protein
LHAFEAFTLVGTELARWIQLHFGEPRKENRIVYSASESLLDMTVPPTDAMKSAVNKVSNICLLLIVLTSSETE